MRIGWSTTLKSSILSLILHVVIGALLILSFDFSPKPKNQLKKDTNIIEAVVVEKKQVEKEIAALRKIEEDKHKKEKKRLNDLEKKVKDLKKKAKKEKRKLADTKKKMKKEQKNIKEKQARIKKLKEEEKKLEEKRKLEEKKVKEAKQKAEKLKAEEKAREERKKKAEAEKKRREKELADAIAEKERKKAEQDAKDRVLVKKLIARIERKIKDNFNITGLPSGLQCELLIYLVPGGKVINVSILKPSGNDIFDRRAVTAVQKASPLPVPDDVAKFERYDLRKINMTFKPQY